MSYFWGCTVYQRIQKGFFHHKIKISIKTFITNSEELNLKKKLSYLFFKILFSYFLHQKDSILNRIAEN
jgi:hypothetical protein